MNKDQQLREQIKNILQGQLSIPDMEITVQNGFALIRSGQEHSLLKKGIQQLSKKIEGIKAFLIEGAAGKPSEQTTALEIIKALENNKENADMKNIIVDICDHEVYIEGIISSRAKRYKIGKTVWEVKGVKNICNLLKLQASRTNIQPAN